MKARSAKVEGRAGDLAVLDDKIEFRADGDPVLKGTDIEVHRIAALLAAGMTPQDICVDYPSLSLGQVAEAGAFAAARPRPARPYPGTTLKRPLKGAGFEALDEVLDP